MNVITLLATIILLCVSMVTQPVRAHCPGRTWYLGEGVRRDGSFACYLSTDKREWPPQDARPDAVIRSRVHCTGGADPIVVNYRTVGCQRRNR